LFSRSLEQKNEMLGLGVKKWEKNTCASLD